MTAILISGNDLPELPGQVSDEPDQSCRNGDVESRNQVVISHPPTYNSSPDHNSDIWNKECKHAENGKAVEYAFFIHFLCGLGCREKEQNQVSHQQEAGQVYQIARFDGDG